MPSVIIHRCVSKRILEKINLFNNDSDKYLFEIGTLAPDSWRNTIRFKESLLPKKEKRKYSHFSNDGEFIERYENFYKKYKEKINNPFMIGYLVHLITDNFWRYEVFYKSFYPDGSIKMADNTILNAEKNEKKELLNSETRKVSNRLAKYYNLKRIRHITDDEINNLPIMDEIEYDGINESIDYNNIEIDNNDNNNYELKVFSEENFINGIDKCSDFIINELLKYKIIKDNR